VDLLQKQLGIGEWAVGGTKLIYEYDKDYYDLERKRRIDAGIVDFLPGRKMNENGLSEGRAHDEMGFKVYNRSEFAKEGYDVSQADD
jgi:hypothetical protein